MTADVGLYFPLFSFTWFPNSLDNLSIIDFEVSDASEIFFTFMALCTDKLVHARGSKVALNYENFVQCHPRLLIFLLHWDPVLDRFSFLLIRHQITPVI